MLKRVKIYLICFTCAISILLLLRIRNAGNTYYPSSMENRRNVRTFMMDENAKENHMALIQSNSYNDLLKRKNILDRTRFKIEYELLNYNFSYSGVQDLKATVMESGGKPLRNMIVSTWRSGTTFLGDVLNSIPGTFYNYEPLLKYGIVTIRGLPTSKEALNNIKNMLKCNFYGMDDYFQFGKSHLHFLHHNSRLQESCNNTRELCYDADFTSKFCKLFPFQLMKLVRLRLHLIKELLDDKELNIKVILLIRDPRGVLNSRRNRCFCQPSPDCWRPDLLCADMVSDYVAAKRFLRQYPQRLMVQRYEDLAFNPYVTTHRIFKFLRLSATEYFDEFLASHTNVENEDPFSTVKISRDRPFKWKNTLDFDYVDEVQRQCKRAMDLWGYRMAHNATHMASKDFDPLDNYTLTQ